MNPRITLAVTKRVLIQLRRDRRTLAMLLVGSIVSGFGSPVAMVVVIASLCFGQLAAAVTGTLPPKSSAQLAEAIEQVSV